MNAAVNVFIPVVRPHKTFGAQRAFERLVARVLAVVSSELIISGKAPGAAGPGTVVRAFPGMATLVDG